MSYPNPDPEEAFARFMGALVAVGIVGAFIYYAWPASICLMGVGIAYRLLPTARRRLRRVEPRRRAVQLSADVVASSLRACLIGLFIGLGVVCIGQIVLRILASTDSWAAILRIELWLSHCNDTLRTSLRLTPSRLLVILLTLTGLILAFPQLRIGQYFTNLRRLAGRLFLVLYVITSFTFFTTYGVNRLEKQWVAAWQVSTREAVDAAIRDRPQRAALETLHQAVRQMPPQTRDALSRYFQSARQREVSNFAARSLAAHLGNAVRVETAGRQAAPLVTASSDRNLSEQTFKRWADGVADIEMKLHAVHALSESAKQERERMRQIRATLCSGLADLVGGHGVASELVEQFVHSAASKFHDVDGLILLGERAVESWVQAHVAIPDVLTPKWDSFLPSTRAEAGATTLDAQIDRYMAEAQQSLHQQREQELEREREQRAMEAAWREAEAVRAELYGGYDKIPLDPERVDAYLRERGIELGSVDLEFRRQILELGEGGTSQLDRVVQEYVNKAADAHAQRQYREERGRVERIFRR